MSEEPWSSLVILGLAVLEPEKRRQGWEDCVVWPVSSMGALGKLLACVCTLAPWGPQRLTDVLYLGPAVVAGSSRPAMVRPQQLAAMLMLRWPRCSLSAWLCVRSCRWLAPPGWAEIVRNKWFRERRKSPWPGRPKLPLRSATLVAVLRAGRARWLYLSWARWAA